MQSSSSSAAQGQGQGSGGEGQINATGTLAQSFGSTIDEHDESVNAQTLQETADPPPTGIPIQAADRPVAETPPASPATLRHGSGAGLQNHRGIREHNHYLPRCVQGGVHKGLQPAQCVLRSVWTQTTELPGPMRLWSRFRRHALTPCLKSYLR